MKSSHKFGGDQAWKPTFEFFSPLLKIWQSNTGLSAALAAWVCCDQVVLQAGSPGITDDITLRSTNHWRDPGMTTQPSAAGDWLLAMWCHLSGTPAARIRSTDTMNTSCSMRASALAMDYWWFAKKLHISRQAALITILLDNCLVNYICQVNGVNWQIYCFTCFSVHPSICVHPESMSKTDSRFEPGTFACQANVISTTLRWLRNNGVYKSLNTCPTTSEQKQNNDFYFKG